MALLGIIRYWIVLPFNEIPEALPAPRIELLLPVIIVLLCFVGLRLRRIDERSKRGLRPKKSKDEPGLKKTRLDTGEVHKDDKTK